MTGDLTGTTFAAASPLMPAPTTSTRGLVEVRAAAMVGVLVGDVEGEGVGETVAPVTPTRKNACDVTKKQQTMKG